MSLYDRLKDKGAKTPEPFEARPSLLLLPNVPMPMSGVAPRVVLGTERWDKTRKAAYRSTQYRCAACAVTAAEAREKQHLEGHEVYSIDYPAGRMVYVETVPLCYYCHSFIHSGRLHALYGKGEISKSKYHAILSHGHEVLSRAGLRMVAPYSGPIAKWADWRLVIDGKEYPPVFKTFEEWDKHFNEEKET